jgi:hypothetical protein
MPDDVFHYSNRRTGEVIAVGPLDLLNDRLAAHRTAEAAITLSRIEADLNARARADALQVREDAVEAREQIQFADQVKSFADAVDRLSARVDREEQRRLQAKLDAMPDFDDPRSHSDNLQAPLPPSEPAHEERLAAMSAEKPLPDAQDALDRGDEEGGVPAEPFEGPRILASLAAPPLAQHSVAPRHAMVFRRDVKALKRQMRGVN